jgi:hypothetical protein
MRLSLIIDSALVFKVNESQNLIAYNREGISADDNFIVRLNSRFAEG